MPIAEELQVIIKAEVSNAVKGIETVNKKTQEATKEQGHLANQLKSVGAAMLGAFAATKVLSAIKNFSDVSSKAASDAEEIDSKFRTVFKNLAGDTEEWAKTYSASVGTSVTESKKFLATIQDTLVPLGFARKAASDMSREVVKLAIDLASFNNLPTETVVRDIQSAIVGNTETLRKYGVVASQAAIEQEALNSGLVTNKNEIDANIKAQAILNLTLKGTVDAQGDAIRTADSFANTQKRLNSQLLTLKETIGNLLNPEIKNMNLFWIDALKYITDVATKSASVAKDLKIVYEIMNTGSRGFGQTIAEYNAEIKALQEGLVQVNIAAARGDFTARKQRDTINEQIESRRNLIKILERQKIAESFSDEGAARLGSADRKAEEQKAAIEKINEARASAIALLEQYGKVTDMVGDIDNQVHFGIMANAEEVAMAWAKAGAAAEETNAVKIQAAEEVAEKIIQIESQTNEQLLQIYATRASAAVSAVNSLGSAYLDLRNLQIDAERQVMNEKIALMREAGASEEEITKQTAGMKKRIFEQEKRMRIAQATMSGAQGIVTTLASVPYPFNLPLAAAMAGLVSAQIATIASQKMPALAKGGDIMTGGSVLVGEKGPEILNLPAGARVKPLDKSGGVVVNISGNSFVGAGGVDELAQMIHNSLSRQRRTGAVA